MYRSASQPSRAVQAGVVSSAPTLCVVDSRPDDGQAWESWATNHGARLRYFTSTVEALRYGRTHAVRQWVVNASLPGISGIELCQMLKQERLATAIYVMTDCYSATEERAARIAGATMYLCRPPDRDWLLPIATPRSQQVC